MLYQHDFYVIAIRIAIFEYVLHVYECDEFKHNRNMYAVNNIICIYIYYNTVY